MGAWPLSCFFLAVIGISMSSAFFHTRYNNVTVTLRLGDDILAGTQLGNISSMSSNIPPPYLPTGYYRVMMEPNRFADQYFSVDAHTSAVSVRSNIDRDEVCRQLSCCTRLWCKTRFKVFIRLSDISLIRVSVNVLFKDVNDNTPVFESNYLPIAESIAVGTTIPLPIAKDKDSLANGIRQYRLFDPSGTFFFYQDSSERPMLRLMKRLDADDRHKRSYALSYSAVDKGDPVRTGHVTLQVRVVDENDNAPRFAFDSRSEFINEAKPVGTEVHKFHAIDADFEEDNRRITYQLNAAESEPKSVASQRFRVDPITGAVIIQSPLDYERLTERKFVLVVEARDHGSPSLTATARLTVNVTPFNDNDPRITITASQPLVEEMAKGQRVRTISVNDPDQLSSERINCSLRNNRGFAISPIRAPHYFDIVTTRVFDHEIQAEVTVTIACTDREPPIRTVYQTLQIPIMDINDHSPIFSPSSYSTIVPENARRNEEVLTVRATDIDSGPRGEILYSLDRVGARFFRIDKRRGIVYVNSTLDRETTPLLHFKVHAEDIGNPSRMTSARVRVALTDVNDNSPVFASPHSVHLLENARRGTVVATIRFFDPDLGRNGAVSFRLVRDKNLALRYLNMTPGGQVIVIRPVDRESIKEMYVDIWAHDRGSPMRETRASLVIHILDVNDNKPRLKFPVEFSVLGLNPPIYTDSLFNTTVTTLIGEDRDLYENGTVVYEIVESNATGLFHLDFITGRLYTIWEHSTRPSHGLYRLVVRLSDRGSPPLFTTAELFIVVGPESYASAAGHTRGVSNVVILVLILVCSVAIATLLIIGILWARARGKRSRGSVAQRAAQYLGYDPAVKKRLSCDPADTDSELVSNAELVTRIAPEPQTDSISCNTMTPCKKTPCQLHPEEHAPSCPVSSLRRNRSPVCSEMNTSNQFRTLGPHPSGGNSFAMENFSSLNRHYTSSSAVKQRPMAMVSAHLLTEVYEDDPRQSDLSYDDSGKGGSVEDLSRFMLAQHSNPSATVHLPVTSRASLRPSSASSSSNVTGRETLC